VIHKNPSEAPCPQAIDAEVLRQQTFGPDKILDPSFAEHVRGVVIRAISQHANLGIVRERIADAVTEALTGKEMRPKDIQRSVAYVDLISGEIGDGPDCPDCRRLAEEDGDILPPACDVHRESP